MAGFIDNLPRLLSLLERARGNLNILQQTYKDEPDILAFYEPSARYLIHATEQEIRALVFDTLGVADADVWIHLEGPELGSSNTPVGVVGRFLEKLSIANKHAVSIIERANHEGRRFSQEITDLAEFNLIATAPGSLRIGLQKPDISRFIPSEPVAEQEKIEETLVQQISDAQLKAQKAMDGLCLLTRTISAAQDENEIEKLYKEVGHKNTLRLIHYAKDLTPPKRGPFTSISFIGPGIGSKSSGSKVVADCETRVWLSNRSEQLLDNQRYVEARGRIRAIDADRRFVHARPLYFDDQYIDDIECKLPIDIEDEELERLFNKPAFVSGLIVLSTTGEAKYIEVDEIRLENPED
ncbi:MAG: hypothetical protein GX986_12675 [Firmicutes bacterium]|nr:hypothetical protein [Bacillota bacterium]